MNKLETRLREELRRRLAELCPKFRFRWREPASISDDEEELSLSASLVRGKEDRPELLIGVGCSLRLFSARPSFCWRVDHVESGKTWRGVIERSNNFRLRDLPEGEYTLSLTLLRSLAEKLEQFIDTQSKGHSDFSLRNVRVLQPAEGQDRSPDYSMGACASPPPRQIVPVVFCLDQPAEAIPADEIKVFFARTEGGRNTLRITLALRRPEDRPSSVVSSRAFLIDPVSLAESLRGILPEAAADDPEQEIRRLFAAWAHEDSPAATLFIAELAELHGNVYEDGKGDFEQLVDKDQEEFPPAPFPLYVAVGLPPKGNTP